MPKEETRTVQKKRIIINIGNNLLRDPLQLPIFIRVPQNFEGISKYTVMMKRKYILFDNDSILVDTEKFCSGRPKEDNIGNVLFGFHRLAVKKFYVACLRCTR